MKNHAAEPEIRSLTKPNSKPYHTDSVGVKIIFANLDGIWAIDRDLIFFPVRVFDLEFVIFESVNQNSVGLIVKKI